MKHQRIFILLMIPLLAACKHATNPDNSSCTAQQDTVTQPLSTMTTDSPSTEQTSSAEVSSTAQPSLEEVRKLFPLPQIPIMLTVPEQRMEYSVQHYWDCLAEADTTLVLHHPQELEQAWADYCNLLLHAPLEVSQQAVAAFFSTQEKEMKVYTAFKSLAEKYLDDPNSPFRNEDLYIPILKSMVGSSALSNLDKLRPRQRLKLALQNRPGNRSANFTYTLPDGQQGTLHSVRAEYTLLFFNNPGCEACAATIGELKNSPVISRLVDEQRLVILGIYPDEELEEWHRHLSDFPTAWITAYDKAQVIRTKQVYDLRAIPTLYLLDKDKKVLLKDATMEKILENLSQLSF